MTHATRIAPLVLGLALAAGPALAQSGHQGRPFDLREFERLVSRFAHDEYGQSRQGPEQTERFAKSFRAGASGVLDLSNLAGDIRVKGAAGDTIAIEAVKRTRRANAEEAKQELASVRIETVERGGRVDVRTTYPRRDNRVSVDFTVTVPAGGSVYVHSLAGDVDITNVKGEVRAETISGNMTVDGLGRLVRLKTMSGDVEIGAVDPQAEVSATSISGTVFTRKLTARTLEATTVTGEVRLGDVTCDRVTAGSMSGNVEYTGAFAKTGRYDFKSHSGDIRLTLPANAGFDVEATSFSGNLRSALFQIEQASTRRGHRGMPIGQSARATVGGGGAILVLHTFSGNIVVNKR